MKKVFFIILFICSSFVYGQNQEKLVISGWKQETGVIDYYENGLIKNFTYGSNSISCTILKESENSLAANVEWNKNGSVYKTLLDIKISTDSIVFNSDFILPDNKISEKDIKISGNTFSNSDFYVDLSYEHFNYTRNKQDWILINNSIYDKNSYGQIDKQILILPLARVISSGKETCIGRYNCYEFNTGGFTYTCDEKISYTQVINKSKISNAFKFLNFYLVSAELDPSFLPFILLFPEVKPFEKKNSIISYESRSYLIEKDAVYSAENLRTIADLPWASSNGYGIGDIIYLTVDINTNLSLTFYNGFQSEKDYLYNLNSRVKTIEITNIDTNKKQIFFLQDTTKKQTFNIQNISDTSNHVGRFSIKILDVYQGIKYKDLCIQSIVIE